MNKNDDFSLFIKRFGRFLRKEGNQRRPNFNPKKNFKKGEESSPIPRCYGCNQLGHMKMECPNYKKKMKKLEKKYLKEKKAKRENSQSRKMGESRKKRENSRSKIRREKKKYAKRS